MANTRKRRPQPRRQNNLPPEPEQFDTFDEMLADAVGDVETLIMPIPQWDPETDERIADVREPIPCPDGDAMEDWNTAARSGDDYLAYLARYGEDIGERLWRATGKSPFVARQKIMSRVLVHYSLAAADGQGINPQS